MKDEEKNIDASDISTWNIYRKMQAVSNEVRNIEKDMTVGKGTYAYKAVSDLDVTLAIKDAETKFGLYSVPVRQDLINSEILSIKKSNGDEGRSFVDTIKMTIHIINLDKPDEEVFVESFGKGVDPGDKGFGKASTYARKIGLLNAYKIPTGEDPDANKSEEIVSPSTPNEKLVVLENFFEKNNAALMGVLEHYSIGTIKDATDKQINVIYGTYKQKGLL